MMFNKCPLIVVFNNVVYTVFSAPSSSSFVKIELSYI